MTEFNPLRIVRAYEKTVEYFHESNEYYWVYDLFYGVMNSDDADDIKSNIEYLMNVDGRSYSESYDYHRALTFIDTLNTNCPCFLNNAIDDAFTGLNDDYLDLDYTGVEDLIERAKNELYEGDRYDDKPALSLVCDINDMAIWSAASFFVSVYENNLAID